MKRGKICVVVGGQYGSEGKGVITHAIADDYGVHIRVGAPNAGHSFYMDGKVWVQQVIPCGWTNLKAKLVLGRGMLINIDILKKEIAALEQVDPLIRSRVFIDEKAGVLSPEFVAQENHTHGEIHKRIGSTGEGVGAAREARVSRGRIPFKLIKDIAEQEGIQDMVVKNTPALISNWRIQGTNILLEGTQGSGLSLIHGPYPYCTSTDTNASQMCADVGIPGNLVTEVILVCRTFPIRVAGNSGPINHEISWEELSYEIGKEVIERTTVTKKVRRIARWDNELVSEAVILNAPTAIALTFIDYINPKDEGIINYSDLSCKAKKFIEKVEDEHGIPVKYIGTGGKDKNWQVIIKD